MDEPSKVRERIVEVLAKYAVSIPDAPLDALVLAMERIITNDVLRLGEMRAASKPPLAHRASPAQVYAMNSDD